MMPRWWNAALMLWEDFVAGTPQARRLRRTIWEVCFAIACVLGSFWTGTRVGRYYGPSEEHVEFTALTGTISAIAWALATIKGLQVQDEANFVAACFAAMSLSSGLTVVTACGGDFGVGPIACRWEQTDLFGLR
jgi:hypothetical protein